MKAFKYLPILAVALFDAISPSDNGALIPTLWANESLVVLEANMIMGNLVYRDFENTFANFGDTVNTRKPNTFTGKRKTDDDDVTIQTASSTNIPVVLNQWIHVSFLIKDGQRSTSFKDLVAFYLQPALIAQATFLDRVICAQAIQFIQYNAGQLGQLSGSGGTTTDYTLKAREILTNNLVPVNGRNLMLTTSSDTQFQRTPLFVFAEHRGDGGSMLETSNIGKLHGFNVYSCQNQPQVATGSSTGTTFTISNSAGYGVGTTVMTLTGSGGILVTGTYITIAGDLVPQRITAHTETAGNTTSVTVFPGLSFAVVNTAQVTNYVPGAVNQASSGVLGTTSYNSGYPANWSKEIVYDVFTVDPKLGQPVNFGDGNVYCIVGVDVVGKTITLDQPLKAAILDDAPICVGPPGSYNLAFDRLALALVVRPLQPPEEGLGARSAFVEHNGFAIRVTMSYNGTKQGHLVTVDALCGVTPLDTVRGCVLLG